MLKTAKHCGWWTRQFFLFLKIVIYSATAACYNKLPSQIHTVIRVLFAQSPTGISARQWLQFTPNAALTNTRQATPPGDFRYGDESRVEVAVLLDGIMTGGFSLNLETSRVLLPIIVK